jgi:hypothetical protein
MSCDTNHQDHGDHEEDEMQVAGNEEVEESNKNCAESSTVMTCEALCALSSSPPPASCAANGDVDSSDEKSSRRSNKDCPKQHQLPMFLSSKYSCWVGCIYVPTIEWLIVDGRQSTVVGSNEPASLLRPTTRGQ